MNIASVAVNTSQKDMQRMIRGNGNHLCLNMMMEHQCQMKKLKNLSKNLKTMKTSNLSANGNLQRKVLGWAKFLIISVLTMNKNGKCKFCRWLEKENNQYICGYVAEVYHIRKAVNEDDACSINKFQLQIKVRILRK